MEEVIARYGPLGVFVGAAIEYDATLILAGVAVHLGLLGLPEAVALGALGSLAGDSAWYALGRAGSPAIRRRDAYRRVGPFIERLADRAGPWQIVVARFVYGVRNATMLFWGMRGLGYLRFLVLDALGTTLGAVCLVLLGFAMSGSAETLLGRVEAVEKWFFGAAVAVAGVVLVWAAASRRLRAR